jgi:hypothetical protein
MKANGACVALLYPVFEPKFIIHHLFAVTWDGCEWREEASQTEMWN